MQEVTRYSQLWELIRLSKPSKVLLLIAVLFEVFGAIAAVWIPMQTRELLDAIGAESLVPWSMLLVLLVLMIANSFADGVAYYLSGKLGGRLVQSLRRLFLAHFIHLPMSVLSQNASAEPASRLVNDSEALRGLFSQQLLPLISGVLNITCSMAILWWLDWLLSCLLLGVVLFAFMVIVPVASKLVDVSVNMQTQEAAFFSRLAEVFANMPLVKSYQAEASEIKRGEGSASDLYQLGMREVRVQAVLTPIIGIAITSSLIVILGYGAVRVEQGLLSIGSLVAFILYLFNIVMPLVQFNFLISGINTAAGAATRLYELLHTPAEDLQIGLSRIEPANAIQLRDVSFAYKSGLTVIDRLSVNIPYGQTTAIVGLSGSGKSTLFKLLNRLYDVDSGEIICGAQNINEISLIAWRKQLAYVSQESSLMSGTIKQNLSYGIGETIEDAQMLNALQQAQLMDWFESLPEGLETQIRESGANLSGGQRQRFAIARAVLRDAKILLLDEVTSSLDVETENQLQLALNSVILDRTVIVAAHRLYTVMHADQIIMLDQGRLLGVGRHEELMQTLPEYQALVETQLSSIQSLRRDR